MSLYLLGAGLCKEKPSRIKSVLTVLQAGSNLKSISQERREIDMSKTHSFSLFLFEIVQPELIQVQMSGEMI